MQSSSKNLANQTTATSQGAMPGYHNNSVKIRQVGASYDMDLTYITERIIALSFPFDGHELEYRRNLQEVAKMLRSKHSDNYTIINLSEKRDDMQRLNPLKVLEFGWPDHLAPPVDRLCNICKCIESWLNSDVGNVIVLHCKGGKGRTGVVIAAYMRYNNICASADQDLDRFAMKKFYDDKLGGLTHPSQRRYVHYFGGFLSGAIKINSNPLYLHHMIIHGVPNFDARGGCRPYIKVYQAMQPIFISGVYTLSPNMTQFSIALEPCLQLRGDVLIKCYHKRLHSSTRDVLFRCQFHTCAISHNQLVFEKADLDEACMDARFPDHARVEFVFSQGQDRVMRYDLLRDQHQPVEAAVEPLERWDSYENFHNGAGDASLDSTLDADFGGLPHSESRVRVMHVQHTEGPLDGSLYATVNKPRRESTPKHSAPSPVIPNGGNSTLHNGPLNHSADSGISSSGFPGSSNVPSSSNQSKSSAMTTVAQSPNRPPIDQQTQLDELLNDLLSDTLFKDPTETLERRQDKGVVVPSQGSLTTHSGNSRTIVSWDTCQAGPSRSVTVTKETSARPTPNSKIETVTKQTEEVSYGKSPVGGAPYGKSQVMNGSLTRDDLDRSFGSSVHESRTFDSRVSTMTREGLTPPAPPPRDMTKSPVFRDRIGSPTLREGVASPPTYNPVGSPTPPARYAHLPYRVDYDNQNAHTESYNMSQYRGYASDSEEPLSWLERQQEKLQAKRDGRTWRNRSERERALVSELRSAQSHIKQRRAQSDVEDNVSDRVEPEQKPVVYGQQAAYNHVPSRRQMSPEPLRKAMTPDPIRRSHSVQGDSYKAERSYFVSGVERPPFTTHQTKYTFSVSPPKPASTVNGDPYNVTSKPPPSPNLGRSSAPNSPIIPQRNNSSREAVRSRTLTRESHAGYSPKLDELERNLQAALQTPSQSAPRRSDNSGYDSDDISRTTQYSESRQTAGQSYETRQTYSTYQTKTAQEKKVAAKVQPEEDEVIEEDVISLQPIGVGVRELEPNATLPRSTMPRATTPAFPVQVVTTPPFPVTPKTPYENKGTTSPLSATLPAKQTSPTARQPQHSATVARQQHTTQNFQQFSSQQQTANQNAPYGMQTEMAHVQTSPNNAIQGAPGAFPPTYNTAQRDTPQQAAHPPAYNTLQREQQQQQQSYSVQQNVQKQYSNRGPQTSPGGSTVPGGQTITQQTVQRSYTQSGVPQGDGGVQGVQQREEYSTHSVQYGVDGTHGGQPASQQQMIQQNYQTGVQQENTQQRHQHTQQVTHQHQQVNQQQQIQQQQQLQQQQQHLQQQQLQEQQLKQQQLQEQQLKQQQLQEQQLKQQQLQQQQMEQQQLLQQQIQQQQLQQQREVQQQQQMSQHVTGHQYTHQGGAMQNGTLHVDTNIRGGMGTMPRSPSSAGSVHSPPSPGSVQMIRTQLSHGDAVTPGAHSLTGQSSPSIYFGQSRRGSLTSLGEGSEVVHHTPRFVRDTSKYWYKPHISREEAIILLKDKQPGTFVVRDSNSFPGAFGLALKVAQVPPNVQTKGGDPLAELVRHFLIEPTPKGVKLKGCSNEPVFGSLAALVYQHSITPLALPCKLLLPETATPAELAMIYREEHATEDVVDAKKEAVNSSTIMSQGAACNVLYISSVDMESLTGREAVAKAIKDSLTTTPPTAKMTVAHFKVSSQGITLTDNKRKLFFRRHYPLNTVTYCGMDPEDRRWKERAEEQGPQLNAKLFGFVARKPGSNTENACHIFAEIDPDQPAHAIVSFVAKVMTGQGQFMR